MSDTEQKQLTLSQYLAPIKAAIKAEFGRPQWVVADIVSIKVKGSVSFELAEHIGDKQVAYARGVMWLAPYNSLVKKLKASGLTLQNGTKALLSVSAKYHEIYGFSLEIADIDANFLLGDLEARIQAARERLKAEGLYDRNTKLPEPREFTNVYVLTPTEAAALGDFKLVANRLHEAKLVRFRYFSATFQGPKASASMLERLREIYKLLQEMPAEQWPDAIVVTRGGGAKGDLAWLSTYEIAKALAHMPVPVYVGIGHEEDRGLLDEVAKRAFSTPTGVVSYIESVVTGNANYAESRITRIIAGANSLLEQKSQRCQRMQAKVAQLAGNALNGFESNSRSLMQRTMASANAGVATSASVVQQRSMTILSDARHTAAAVDAATQRMGDRVLSGAKHGLRDLEQGVRDSRTRIVSGAGGVLVADAQVIRDNVRAIRQQAGHKISTLASDSERSAGMVLRYASDCVNQIANKLDHNQKMVMAYSPEKTLQRGYSIIRVGGKVVPAVSDLTAGDGIDVTMRDGSLSATVTDVAVDKQADENNEAVAGV